MKLQITQTLNRNIVADDAMAKFVRVLCFVAGIFVLGLSLWKLSHLDLTESQIFFGVLLSGIMPMLLIVLGLLLPIAITPKSA
jgi:uncharacterized membrane protein YiaA